MSIIWFIEEKIKNFTCLVYELWNNKEEIIEMEKKVKNDRAKILLSILFLNENNKNDYIKDFMKKSYIDDTEDNYKKIEWYVNMFLEIKGEYFNS